MAVRIITDSAADFDQAVAARRRICVVPMTVQFGPAAFIDGKSITSDVFYRLLALGQEAPTTSQPSPDAFLRVFEAVKAAGDQAVVVTISGALSGTLQSAMVAKGLCGYEHISIVDSRTATAGMQLLVNHACKLRDSGLDAPGIARQLEWLRDRVRIFAVIDTLEYLRRGGRLSAAQAGLGAVTRLKPTVTLRDGSIAVVGKSFGMAAGVKNLLKHIQAHPIDDDFPSYFLYTDDRSREELLLPHLDPKPQRLHTCGLGPTLGAHIGPGALGLAYIEQR